MRGKLTKSIVAEALPQGKPYQIHDVELHGFLLRIEPSGSRSYYLLRHADLTMVLRYAHLDPRNLAAAVERVARDVVQAANSGI